MKKNKFNLIVCLLLFIVLIVVAVMVVICLLIPKKTNDNKINIDSNSNIINTNTYQIQIITDYINIREEKSTNSNILGKVYLNDVYDVISEDLESIYNWYEIQTIDGIRGFIAGKSQSVDYVKKIKKSDGITEKEIIQEEIKSEFNEPSIEESNDDVKDITKEGAKEEQKGEIKDISKEDEKEKNEEEIKEDITNEEVQNNSVVKCGSEGYLYNNWNNYYIEPNQMLAFFGCDVGEQNMQEYHDKNYEDIYWNLEKFNIRNLLDDCTQYYSLECMAGGGTNPVYDVATGQIVGYASHVTISHTNAISGRGTVYVGQGYIGRDNFYWLEKLY